MDKNELRIGNWVNEEVLGNCAVSDICEHVVMVKVNNGRLDGTTSKVTYTLNYNCISAIPLTEEWLLDFGFEKDELGWFFKENDYCSFGLFFKNNEWLFYISDTKIKYVHQLQNLYFALTNNELTNKLQM